MENNGKFYRDEKNNLKVESTPMKEFHVTKEDAGYTLQYVEGDALIYVWGEQAA